MKVPHNSILSIDLYFSGLESQYTADTENAKDRLRFDQRIPSAYQNNTSSFITQAIEMLVA